MNGWVRLLTVVVFSRFQLLGHSVLVVFCSLGPRRCLHLRGNDDAADQCTRQTRKFPSVTARTKRKGNPSFVDSTIEDTKLRSEKSSLARAILYTSKTYRWGQGCSSAPVLLPVCGALVKQRKRVYGRASLIQTNNYRPRTTWQLGMRE